MDPGEHHFAFDGADGMHVEKTVVAREGDTDRHVSVVFGTPSAASPGDAGSPAGAPNDATQSGSRAPVATYIALGVAGVGLIVGAALTIAWASENGKCSTMARDACLALYPNHESTLTADTVGAAAGFGVAVVGAGLGWLLWPSKSSAGTPEGTGISPRLGVGWLGVEGRFE